MKRRCSLEDICLWSKVNQRTPKTIKNLVLSLGVEKYVEIIKYKCDEIHEKNMQP